MKQLLFVDDEPNFLAAMQRMLRKDQDKWQAFFAESVQEALQLVTTNNFDVILSDYQMPGKSRFDLLATLQNNRATRAIPVIILTGSGEKHIRMKSFSTISLSKNESKKELPSSSFSILTTPGPTINENKVNPILPLRDQSVVRRHLQLFTDVQ